MHQILELVHYYIIAFSSALPVCIVLILLVYFQYRRAATLEKHLFGRTINPVARQMVGSIGLGTGAGLIAGLILVFLGLSIEQVGILFILPVAVLLLLVNPRFLCFAYAGGLVGLVSILMRAVVRFYPGLQSNVVIESLVNIHIPALLILIGLLHLVEALLISISGHWGCSPLYYRGPHGKVVGGFSLQRFWPIPLVTLMMIVVPETDVSGIALPDWWPLIKPILELEPGQIFLYSMCPVAAGLGYGDLAISSRPREKARLTARYLAAYSLTLLALAVAAQFWPFLMLPAVLLAPLGHEFLILYGNRLEMSRLPRYQVLPRGIQVMMVLPGSPAAEAGIKADDIILSVNGAAVYSQQDLINHLERSYFMVLLEIKRAGDRISTVFKKRTREAEAKAGPVNRPQPVSETHRLLYRITDLGLILAPPPTFPIFMETKRRFSLFDFRRRTADKNR